MKQGRRLYQAIVDKCIEESLDIEGALTECEIDPNWMTASIEMDPDEILPPVEEVISRKAIDACANFLCVSGIRVFLLLEIFSINDISGYSFLSKNSAMSVASYYLDTLASTNIFGKFDLLLNELEASTMSRNLDEVAEKTQISAQTLERWRGDMCAQMSDHAAIKIAAKTCGMSKPAVMACLDLLKKEDFRLNGKEVRVIDELEMALSVEVW